jgi:hypothetical protein
VSIPGGPASDTWSQDRQIHQELMLCFFFFSACSKSRASKWGDTNRRSRQPKFGGRWQRGSKFSFFDSSVRQNLVDMDDRRSWRYRLSFQLILIKTTDECANLMESLQREEENGMPYAASPGFSEDYLPAASLSVKEIISNKVSWLDLLEMD